MKKINQCINEKKNDISSSTSRADIKFDIWKSSGERAKWLKDDEKYNKIEYKLVDKKDSLSIDFLLGLDDDSWKMWVGKIGSCTYDDDPYYSFETKSFAQAIVDALDKIKEFVDKVKEEPENYVQFYTNR